ncbi:MAG: hypothetical protein JAY71_18870 [Candidatus Thiodiazotropha weberae]|nr:hypothetical protein [Candidatus Thiodiazotropha weberae]
MTKTSTEKGKSGERELVKLLNDGFESDILGRNLDQARSGGHDLIVHEPPSQPGQEGDRETRETRIRKRMNELAIEVKRHKTAKQHQIEKWWAQACEQALSIRKVPVLFYRPDNQPWKCMMPFFRKLGYDDPGNCITLSADLFIKIIKDPDLTHD